MMSNTQYEVTCRNDLTQRINALEDLWATIDTAAKAKPLGNIDVKEIMKKLSDDVQQCEQLIEAHANGSIPLTNDLLAVVAKTLHSAHECMSAVVFFYAYTPPTRV